MTLHTIYQKAREGLRTALIEAYKGILPVETLEKANPWYESHLRSTVLEVLDATIKEILEATKWVEGTPENEDEKWRIHYGGYREARKDILALLHQEKQKIEDSLLADK